MKKLDWENSVREDEARARAEKNQCGKTDRTAHAQRQQG
jgi:hypothetical protein